MCVGRVVLRRVLLLLLFAGCGAGLWAQTTPPWLNDPDAARWADSVLATLDLEKRIAQSFMVAAYAKGDAAEAKSVTALVEKQHIGGVMFLQGKRERMRELSARYQQKSKTPLLLAIDAEWGSDMRLSDGLAYLKAMGVAATGSPALAYRMGDLLAQELQEIGLHINFAPVVDVQRNPKNPVIGIRGFGDTPDRVTEFGSAYMAGMQSRGLLACAKHFPGHGNTSTDSHHTLPVIGANYAALDTCDLVPFRRLVGEQLSMVMVAHLAMPGLKLPDSVPASLSQYVVTTLLRDSLRFQGLICTDALNMKGASGRLKPDQVALQAYLAGADILLCPDNVPASIKVISYAVRNGKISEAEVAARTRRILMAKYWAVRGQRARQSEVADFSASQRKALDNEREEFAAQMAREAVTVLRNHNNTLPMMGLESLKLSLTTFVRGGQQNDSSAFLMGVHRYTKCVEKRPDFKKGVEAQAIRAVRESTLHVVAVDATGYAPSKNFGVSKEQITFAKTCARHKPTVLVVFGTPYVLTRFFPLSDYAAVVLAYDNTAASQDAVSQVLFGGLSTYGTLPISLPPELKAGDGLTLEGGVRLSYTSPERYGANLAWIARADSLAQMGIDSGAYPGVQILAAHRGEVFYRRNFGRTSYSKYAPPVTDSTIYDLASVTKITATTPLVMRLVEKKN